MAGAGTVHGGLPGSEMPGLGGPAGSARAEPEPPAVATQPAAAAEPEPEPEPAELPDPVEGQPQPQPQPQQPPQQPPHPVRMVCVARAAATEMAEIAGLEMAAGTVAALHVFVPGEVVAVLERAETVAGGRARLRTERGWISVVATDGTVLFVPAGHKALARHRAGPDGIGFDKHWAVLGPAEREAAAALGWEPAGWEVGDGPALCLAAWEDVPAAEQAAAGVLGFEADSWATQRAEHLRARERRPEGGGGGGGPELEAELFGWQQQLGGVCWLRCISPAGLTDGLEFPGVPAATVGRAVPMGWLGHSHDPLLTIPVVETDAAHRRWARQLFRRLTHSADLRRRLGRKTRTIVQHNGPNHLGLWAIRRRRGGSGSSSLGRWSRCWPTAICRLATSGSPEYGTKLLLFLFFQSQNQSREILLDLGDSGRLHWRLPHCVCPPRGPAAAAQPCGRHRAGWWMAGLRSGRPTGPSSGSRLRPARLARTLSLLESPPSLLESLLEARQPIAACCGVRVPLRAAAAGCRRGGRSLDPFVCPAGRRGVLQSTGAGARLARRVSYHRRHNLFCRSSCAAL